MAWEAFRELEEATDDQLHPIITVTLRNVPCAIETGCCTLDLFIRPKTSDPIVLEQV